MKINIKDYEQLALLCHSRDHDIPVDCETALSIYENEWRWLEYDDMKQEEKDLLEMLIKRHSNGILRVKGPFAMRAKYRDKPLVMRLADDAARVGSPQLISEAMSIRELCDKAGIECVDDPAADAKIVGLTDYVDHYIDIQSTPRFYTVGRDFIEEDDESDVALRILEIVAFTLHEPISRQCLRGKKYFIAPPGSYSNPA